MTVYYKFHAQAGDVAFAMQHSEVMEFDEPPTLDELYEIAKEFMWENVAPEFWYEEVEGPEE